MRHRFRARSEGWPPISLRSRREPDRRGPTRMPTNGRADTCPKRGRPIASGVGQGESPPSQVLIPDRCTLETRRHAESGAHRPRSRAGPAHGYGDCAQANTSGHRFSGWHPLSTPRSTDSAPIRSRSGSGGHPLTAPPAGVTSVTRPRDELRPAPGWSTDPTEPPRPRPNHDVPPRTYPPAAEPSSLAIQIRITHATLDAVPRNLACTDPPGLCEVSAADELRRR